MVSQNSEITRKLRTAVRQKIEEYGIDVDDELPDYVMIMIGNKKDKARMKSDLKLFLGENTTNFVEWLFGYFQSLQKTKSMPSSLPSSSDVSIPEIKEKINEAKTTETKIKSKQRTTKIIERRNKKRSLEKEEENANKKGDDNNENNEKLDVKKIRIDSTEKEIDDDESVLVVYLEKMANPSLQKQSRMVYLGKMANRSIQKQSRKPKSSLALLKEHIRHQIEASTGGEKSNKDTGAEMLKKKEQNESNIKKRTGIEEDKFSATNSNKPRQQEQNFQQGEETDKILKKTSETLAIKKTNDGCSNETPLWDGRIEIEDIDDTDDEAEIDAVLKEQNELRKMALERETEIKCMSLPPTAALTRPIYHHPPMSPLSSGKADLLQPVGFGYKTPGSISKVYSAPTIHKISMNNTAEKSKSLLLQQYSNILEEQKLLLAQIQKMPNQDERKNILFKCKQIDKKASELKEQLQKFTEQIASNKDVIPQNSTESTSGLLVKRFY